MTAFKENLGEGDSLTLHKAIEIALALEAAAQDAKDLQSQRNPEVVKKIKQENYACIRCGSKDHKQDKRPHLKAKCFNCGKIGHLGRSCLKRKPQRNYTANKDGNKVHAIAETEISSQIFKIINLWRTTDPIKIEILSLEYDTGSAYSHISDSTLRFFKLPNPCPADPLRVKLATYSGQPLQVLGTLDVPVQYQNSTQTLPLMVVGGEGPSLCGRNWMEALGILPTKPYKVDMIKVTENNLSTQLHRLVGFAFPTLTPAEKKYSQMERETLGIVFGVTRFRNYLLGNSFTLRADHKLLVTLFSENKGIPTIAANCIQRWAIILSAYWYKIEYIKGTSNTEADILSRLPMFTPEQNPKENDSEPVKMVLLMDALDSSPVTSDDIRANLPGDPALRQALDHTLQGWSEATPKEIELMPYWSRRYELGACEGLLFWGNRVIIPTNLRAKMLDELHNSHQGIVGLKSAARTLFWWPGLDKDIEETVRRFGIPRTLVSDNGTGFTSEEFRQFMTRNGILHLWTAPFHPSSNGLAECAVQTIKTGLKKVQQGSISQRLAEILLGYRRTPIASIGKSPSEMMFGHNIRSRLDLILPNPGPKWDQASIQGTTRNRLVTLQTAKWQVRRHWNQIWRSRIPVKRSESTEDHAGVFEPEELIPQRQEVTSEPQSSTELVQSPQTITPSDPVNPLRRSSRIRKPPRLDI
ncbi:K02A2.6-like [Cordylochernes scorpioides]|uniref:RNA-directed DNA polymerase n=1 Tax=Cordylochernes scorpioides TaxID=51811 RepID=A0ABY6KEG6_9ARAC|nr:K02A2.6-like [Cordylochernes scorpioides]